MIERPRRIHPRRLSRLDIELDLLPVDRIFQRWARSVGDGLALPFDEQASSLATPLPDDAAIFVDQYVCSRMPKVKHFLHGWYRGQDSSADIARRLGMHRTDVYLYWRSVLWAAKPIFEAEPCVAHCMQRELTPVASEV